MWRVRGPLLALNPLEPNSPDSSQIAIATAMDMAIRFLLVKRISPGNNFFIDTTIKR